MHFSLLRKWTYFATVICSSLVAPIAYGDSPGGDVAETESAENAVFNPSLATRTEERVRTVPYTVMVPVVRTRTVKKSDGTTEEQTYTVQVPEQRTRTETYTVEVPVVGSKQPVSPPKMKVVRKEDDGSQIVEVTYTDMKQVRVTREVPYTKMIPIIKTRTSVDDNGTTQTETYGETIEETRTRSTSQAEFVPEELTKTVTVPAGEDIDKFVNGQIIKWRKDAALRSPLRQVVSMRSEIRTREVPYTVMVPQTRTRAVANEDGTIKEETYTVTVPEVRTRTETYTVQVPTVSADPVPDPFAPDRKAADVPKFEIVKKNDDGSQVVKYQRVTMKKEIRSREETYSVIVPEERTRVVRGDDGEETTQSYIVSVPQTRTRTVSYTVHVPVHEDVEVTVPAGEEVERFLRKAISR